MDPSESSWVPMDRDRSLGTPPEPQDHPAPHSGALRCQGDASLHPACLPGVVLANTSEPNTLLTLPSTSSLIINRSLGETWCAVFSPGAPTGGGCPRRQPAEMPNWRMRLHPPFPQEFPRARPGHATQPCSPISVSQQLPISLGASQSLLLGFPYTIQFFLGSNPCHTRGASTCLLLTPQIRGRAVFRIPRRRGASYPPVLFVPHGYTIPPLSCPTELLPAAPRASQHPLKHPTTPLSPYCSPSIPVPPEQPNKHPAAPFTILPPSKHPITPQAALAPLLGPVSITFSCACAAGAGPCLCSPALTGVPGERAAQGGGADAAPTWNKLFPGSFPANAGFSKASPTAPRRLWHHRDGGPGKGGTGHEWERLAGNAGLRAGTARLPGAGPGCLRPPRATRLPTHCQATEEPFSPRREQRGHLSPSVTAASTGTLSPRAPLPAPRLPATSPG